MATKRVKINKSNGTFDTFDFTIPEIVGTYNLKFTKSDGGVLNAGNVVVDGTERTYELKFGLSNGQTISAGTFKTPAVASWHTILNSSKKIDGGTTQINGLRANTKTRITFQGKIYYWAGGISGYSFPINQRTNEISDNGQYSGSNTTSEMCSGNFGFNLDMLDNAVELSAYVNGSNQFTDECGFDYCESITFQSVSVTISKIEQYY